MMNHDFLVYLIFRQAGICREKVEHLSEAFGCRMLLAHAGYAQVYDHDDSLLAASWLRKDVTLWRSSSKSHTKLGGKSHGT